MLKKVTKSFLLIVILLSLFIFFAGKPRTGLDSKNYFSEFANFPEALSKINSISVGSNQKPVISFPDDYSDYQIFIGKKLENIELKARVAREFTKFAVIESLQENADSSKVYIHKSSKSDKQSAKFILNKKGELFYQRNKDYKPKLLSEFSSKYFEDISLFRALYKNYSKIAKVSKKMNALTVNLDELDKLALIAENLTVVFYKKPQKERQKRFAIPHMIATEITFSDKTGEREENNQLLLPEDKKYNPDELFENYEDRNKSEQEDLIRAATYENSSSENSSSSSGCEAYGSGSGNEGDSALVSINGDGNAKIESVSISNEEPKQDDWKNAKNDLGQFGWQYEISEDGQSAEAIGKGFKWFGVGDGDDSCIEPIAPNNQAGIYKAELTVNYDNGCQATKEIEIDIDYPSLKGFTSYDIKENLSGYTYQIKPGYPKKPFLLWNCCVDPVCTTGECIKAESSITQKHDAALQYKSLVDQEEQFHVDQNLGNKDWEKGGNSQNGVKSTDFNQFVAKYGLQNVCATGVNQTYACQSAFVKSKTNFKKAFSKYKKNYIRWATKTRCYRELTAKDGVGFTRTKVGMDYKCAYERNGGCAADGGEKRYLWDFIGR